MNVSLHIIYESSGGRPHSAAQVSDRNLLIQVANTAIQEAYEQAKSTAEIDEFLGDVQKEEAERLQRILKTMIPELAEA